MQSNQGPPDGEGSNFKDASSRARSKWGYTSSSSTPLAYTENLHALDMQWQEPPSKFCKTVHAVFHS